MSPLWISTDAALKRLNVKPQTLYAYVSRGLIGVQADPDNPRRHLYSAEDIDRLDQRKHRTRGAVAKQALHHGDPVLSSSITTLGKGGLWYRGRDAVALSETATLEDIARLLWDCDLDPFAGLTFSPQRTSGPDPRARAFALLANRAVTDPVTTGRSADLLWREAAVVLIDLVDAVCGGGRAGLLHERLAKSWRLDGPRVDIIRRCLVLTADHELNASTFAARVAASTGAPLAACALAGLSTLTGPLHGGMTLQVASFIAECRRTGNVRATAMTRLSQGLGIPGFGHPLYPAGDPRAKAIAEALPLADDLHEIQQIGERLTGAAPNLDFALVAATRTLGLPTEAPFTLFSVGRAVGWIAHALEQIGEGQIIRPRAHYVGLPPGQGDRIDERKGALGQRR